MHCFLVGMREEQFVWGDLKIVGIYDTGPSFECHLLRLKSYSELHMTPILKVKWDLLPCTHF